MPPTVETVAAALSEVAKQLGIAAYEDVLAQFGAKVFEELDPADYQAILDYCNVLLGRGNASDKPGTLFAKGIWDRFNKRGVS